MSSDHLSTLLSTAQQAAVLAGDLTREMWQRPRQLTSKGFRDLVTDADFAAQKIITDFIHGRFPDHGFLPEEEVSDLPTTGPIVWIIDPIDGTTNYSRQQPIYSISIAAISSGGGIEEGEVPIVTAREQLLVGVIYDPMRDEMFSGASGQGATLGTRPLRREPFTHQPLRVSEVKSLGEAVIGLDWSHHRHTRQSTLEAIQYFAQHVFTVRAIGSAALGLAWIAAGRFDGYINLNLKPWDIAAADLLIREAGGQLSNVQGQTATWSMEGSDCIASNGLIHQAFLQQLTGSSQASS